MRVMYFNHLKAFYHVSDCRSFTLAAKRLNVSQPTLSLQVQSLEKQCGLPLINRHKKAFELTEEGELIFSYAQSIFSLLHDLENTIEDLNTRSLKIGSTPTLAHYILPGIIQSLKESNPKLRVQLYTGLSREVLQMIVNFEYHVGLIGHLNYPDNIVKRTIAEPKLYFIANDPALPDRLHLEQLASYPIILPETGSATRDYLVAEFKRRGIPMNIYIDCENAQAIKHMVHLGMGGAFFPPYAIQEDIEENKYRKIAIIDDLHLTVDLVYLKDRKNIKMVRHFLSAVQSHSIPN